MRKNQMQKLVRLKEAESLSKRFIHMKKSKQRYYAEGEERDEIIKEVKKWEGRNH